MNIDKNIVAIILGLCVVIVFGLSVFFDINSGIQTSCIAILTALASFVLGGTIVARTQQKTVNEAIMSFINNQTKEKP